MVRKAVEKIKRLEKILEPSSDPSKLVLSEASRSIWLPFVETMRTEYLNYSPYKLKEIRDLVDAYEAGELELEEAVA